MAFNFDTFVKDQKQAAIDVVDTVTPSQIKSVAQSYKEGLTASPKQVVNETLEKLTGIDLGQGVGMDGLGAQVKEFMKGQAADLGMQLEQQILGCINTQIRDLMNKIPELDFILNFEDRINGILGNFRNKLEFKIDAELRKIAYNKIKIHQVAFFKQRIRAKIKDICPGATPASVAEVQDFNNQIKGLLDKREVGNKVVETATTLPAAEITSSTHLSETVSVNAATDPTPHEGPSAKFIRDNQDEGVASATAATATAEVMSEVNSEMEDQVESAQEDDTIETFLEKYPAETLEKMMWGSINVWKYQWDDWSEAQKDSVVAGVTIMEGKSDDEMITASGPDTLGQATGLMGVLYWLKFIIAHQVDYDDPPDTSKNQNHKAANRMLAYNLNRGEGTFHIAVHKYHLINSAKNRTTGLWDIEIMRWFRLYELKKKFLKKTKWESRQEVLDTGKVHYTGTGDTYMSAATNAIKESIRDTKDQITHFVRARGFDKT